MMRKNDLSYASHNLSNFGFKILLIVFILFAHSLNADTRVHGLVFANLEKTTSVGNAEFNKILDGRSINSSDFKRLREILKELEVNPIPTTRFNPFDLRKPIKNSIIKAPSQDKFLAKKILLPDIQLSLIDPRTKETIATTTSDVHGVFNLPEVKKGLYQLCWKGKGWKNGCEEKAITATGTGPAYVKPIQIQPESKRGFRTLAGRVLLKNNTPCRVFNWRHNIDFTAQVQSKQTPSQNVRANSQGYYVLPQVKSTGDEVNVSCGDSDAESIVNALEKTNNSDTNVTFDKTAIEAVLENTAAKTKVSVGDQGDRIVNLTIENSKPFIVDLSFASKFGSASRAPANTEVEITANIIDSEKLALFWMLPVEGAISEGNKVKWVTPKRSGTYRLSLFVGDGRGGWNSITKSFEVTDDPRLPFAGTITINGEAVNAKSSVDVSVNGTSLKLSNEGHFYGKIKPIEEKRYVMNIEAAGMMPISRVFHRESTGGHYNLTNAETMVLDPSNPLPINIGERSTEGSYVKLAPNSLIIEGTGQLATGPVTVTSHYLDPSISVLPGDYDAIGSNGSSQSLISFGAAYVDFRDNQGRKLNLHKDKPAELVMKPAPNSIGDTSLLPPTLPIWTYNMDTGFWDQEKVFAKLENGAYRTSIPHFSTVNLDLGTNVASACVRIQVDFIRTPQNRILKVSTSNGVGGYQVKQVELDQRLNAVYRLLPQSTTTFEMLSSDGESFTNFQLREVNADGTINDVEGNTITLQLGDEQENPDDLWPNEPFTDCKRLFIASGNIPGDKVQPLNDELPEFFTRKQEQTINQEKSEAYYAFMDQADERLNLEGWLTKNGFQPIVSGGGFRFPPAARVVELSYLNHGDLGSGRKMHCRKDDSRVACIVGNYSASSGGNFNRDPASANTAHDAIMGTGFATVGMEYSVVDGSNNDTKAVKFFTYGEGNNRARIFAAALEEDATQERNLPELCQACHGGTLPSTTPSEAIPQGFPENVEEANVLDQVSKDGIINHIANTDPSSFREFDLNAFRNIQGNRPENKVKILNCNYVLPSNPISGIDNLIRGWYGEDCDANSNVGINQPSFVPEAWQTNAEDTDIYTNVVANVCRTCHIAQRNMDFTNPSSGGFDWNAANDGAPYSCNIGAGMPNAPIPFNSYWIDGAHEKMLAQYGECN